MLPAPDGRGRTPQSGGKVFLLQPQFNPLPAQVFAQSKGLFLQIRMLREFQSGGDIEMRREELRVVGKGAHTPEDVGPFL